MIRNIRELGRDERGASLIEMAMLMPVLATMLIGMVDLSRGYSEKLQLEQAAQRSIEKVMQYQASSDTYATLKAEAAAAADVPESAVTVDYWLECNGTRAESYDSTCTGGQTYARWVTIEIRKTFTPMFASMKFLGANSDGTFTLRGKAGLRTQ